MAQAELSSIIVSPAPEPVVVTNTAGMSSARGDEDPIGSVTNSCRSRLIRRCSGAEPVVHPVSPTVELSIRLDCACVEAASRDHLPVCVRAYLDRLVPRRLDYVGAELILGVASPTPKCSSSSLVFADTTGMLLASADLTPIRIAARDRSRAGFISGCSDSQAAAKAVPPAKSSTIARDLVDATDVVVSRIDMEPAAGQVARFSPDLLGGPNVGPGPTVPESSLTGASPTVESPAGRRCARVVFSRRNLDPRCNVLQWLGCALVAGNIFTQSQSARVGVSPTESDALVVDSADPANMIVPDADSGPIQRNVTAVYSSRSSGRIFGRVTEPEFTGAVVAPTIEPTRLRQGTGGLSSQSDECDLEIHWCTHAIIASVASETGTFRADIATYSTVHQVRFLDLDALGCSIDPTSGAALAITADAALALGLRSEVGPETLSLDTFVDGALVAVVAVLAKARLSAVLEHVAFWIIAADAVVPAAAATSSVETSAVVAGISIWHILMCTAVLVARVRCAFGIAGVGRALVAVVTLFVHGLVITFSGL